MRERLDWNLLVSIGLSATRSLGRNERRGLTSRIQNIDINAQVDWFCNLDPVSDFLDNPLRANSIYFPCLENFKAAIAIIVIVTESR